MERAPRISVVIPAYNRVQPLALTLRTARRAAAAVSAEIIVVDDGSAPPLSETLAGRLDFAPTWLRQANAGSMAARQAGLAAARGEFVQFLDSDDLVHPEKFERQIAALDATGAEICYADMATYHLGPDGQPVYAEGPRLEATGDPVRFFLQVQPMPHNPIYRRDYLERHLSRPLLPMDRRLDSVGDIWLYFNLLPYPAKVVKVDAPLAAVGRHDEGRYSRHWEHLAAASLALMERFARDCPRNPGREAVRRALGEIAFESWRRLPRDFHSGYDRRLLRLWRESPRDAAAKLGGPLFRTLAAVLGPAAAGRLLRRWRGGRYADCRTIGDEEYHRLFSPFEH